MSTPDAPSAKPVTPPVESQTPALISPETAAHPPLVLPTAAPSAGHHEAKAASHWRRWALIAFGIAALAWGAYAATPWVITAFTTVSTDDAYVAGHVTFVAARVSGQVARVMVDNNNRVRKGELLVELDREPFEVKVKIAQSQVTAAEADVVATQAQIRSVAGQMRSLRYTLQHAMEDVNNQIALLRARVATVDSQKASLSRAQADFKRAEQLIGSNAISKEEFDTRKESLLVAQSHVEEALEGVRQVRVALGLTKDPPEGKGLADVPKDLDENFSTVRQALASLMQTAAQLGVTESFTKTPRQLISDFYKRDPEGRIDHIYEQIMADAPALKQSKAKLEEARRNLDEAQLNLRYCAVMAEIDGIIVRRSVNPGNNVVAGQSLMAIRSLTDIWIDANFKETQLGELRIGQAVDIEVDMYGKRHEFRGRISGFTMGTGSTLSLLPPENATGNFVKVVQRLPVRIDLLDYDPEDAALFYGLSVTPYVHINEPPSGPNAGKLLQPYLSSAAEATPAAGAVETTPAAESKATEARP